MTSKKNVSISKPSVSYRIQEMIARNENVVNREPQSAVSNSLSDGVAANTPPLVLHNTEPVVLPNQNSENKEYQFPPNFWTATIQNTIAAPSTARTKAPLNHTHNQLVKMEPSTTTHSILHRPWKDDTMPVPSKVARKNEGDSSVELASFLIDSAARITPRLNTGQPPAKCAKHVHVKRPASLYVPRPAEPRQNNGTPLPHIIQSDFVKLEPRSPISFQVIQNNLAPSTSNKRSPQLPSKDPIIGENTLSRFVGGTTSGRKTVRESGAEMPSPSTEPATLPNLTMLKTEKELPLDVSHVIDKLLFPSTSQANIAATVPMNRELPLDATGNRMVTQRKVAHNNGTELPFHPIEQAIFPGDRVVKPKQELPSVDFSAATRNGISDPSTTRAVDMVFDNRIPLFDSPISIANIPNFQTATRIRNELTFHPVFPNDVAVKVEPGLPVATRPALNRNGTEMPPTSRQLDIANIQALINTSTSYVARSMNLGLSPDNAGNHSAIGGEIVVKTEPTSPKSVRKNESSVLYKQLKALGDRGGYITNAEEFDCIICFATTEVGDGVRLRDCLHEFCLECIKSSILLSNDAEISCPFGDGNHKCDGKILDPEIRAILNKDEYERHLARSLRVAEGTISGTVHCKLPNCDGWLICDDDVNQFACPKCQRQNCISCQAIHDGRNCKQYQDDLKYAGPDGDARRSLAYLDELIEKNLAMKCPKCQILIMKRDGCDGLVCFMCRTEICWITKQARWGPKGSGDTSGGCRCRVDGKRCHPLCGNCH